MPTIDEQMNTFRLAARSVFNHYFRPPPDDETNDAWTELERFGHVECALFNALVAQPFGLKNRIYRQ